jgi:hypothetical protein
MRRLNCSVRPCPWPGELVQMLRWNINLLDDGSVVTQQGEYLGTWDTDENDHPFFTPDGESEVLLFDVFIPMLCDRIEAWHNAKT